MLLYDDVIASNDDDDSIDGVTVMTMMAEMTMLRLTVMTTTVR